MGVAPRLIMVGESSSQQALKLIDLSARVLDWRFHCGTSYNEDQGRWHIVPMSGQITLDNTDGRLAHGSDDPIITAADASRIRPAIFELEGTGWRDRWAVFSVAPAFAYQFDSDNQVVFEVLPRYSTFLEAPVSWAQRHSDDPVRVLDVADALITATVGDQDVISPASQSGSTQWMRNVRISAPSLYAALENLAWSAGMIPAETLNGQIALITAEKSVVTSALRTPPDRLPLTSSIGQSLSVRRSWALDVAGPSVDETASSFTVPAITLPSTSGRAVVGYYGYIYPDGVDRVDWKQARITGGHGGQVATLSSIRYNPLSNLPGGQRGDGITYVYRNPGGPTPSQLVLSGTAYSAETHTQPVWVSGRRPGEYQPTQSPPPWIDWRPHTVPGSAQPVVNDLAGHEEVALLSSLPLTRFVLNYPILDETTRITGDPTRSIGFLVPGSGGAYRLGPDADHVTPGLICETITLTGSTDDATILTVTGVTAGTVTGTPGSYVPPNPTDALDPSDSPRTDPDGGSNARLATLTVTASPGKVTLAPDFDAETFTYGLTVHGQGKQTVTVAATAADGLTVTGTGDTVLESGTDEATITVRVTDTSAVAARFTDYVINVERDDGTPRVGSVTFTSDANDQTQTLIPVFNPLTDTYDVQFNDDAMTGDTTYRVTIQGTADDGFPFGSSNGRYGIQFGISVNNALSWGTYNARLGPLSFSGDIASGSIPFGGNGIVFRIVPYEQRFSSNPTNIRSYWFTFLAPGEGPADPEAPTAPGSVSVNAGDTQATLTWAAPSDWGNGTEASRKYEVSVRETSGTAAATVTDALASATSNTFTGLTNGTQYTFGIRAVTSAGESDWTYQNGTPSKTSVKTAPRVPTTPKAEGGDKSVTISVSPPTSWGTGTATTRRYQWRQGTSGTVYTSTLAARTFTGLTNGVRYTLQARCSTDHGTSAWVSASAVANPPAPVTTKPGVPIRLSVSFGSSTAMSLSWQRGATGNAPDSYTYRYRTTTHPPNTPWVSGTIEASSITGLIVVANTKYDVQVLATNTVGSSDWTAVVQGTSPPTETDPSVPRNVTATGVDTGIRLDWDAPSDWGNGDSQSRVYYVQIDAKTAVQVARAETYTFTPLTNGAKHTVRVQARTNHGTSVWVSRTQSAGVNTPPGVPRAVQATAPVDNAVELEWSAPADWGGAAVNSREYQAQLGSTGTIITISDNAFRRRWSTGIVAGTLYVMRVRAKTTHGESNWVAQSVRATGKIAPDPPNRFAGTAGVSSVKLTWAQPASWGSGDFERRRFFLTASWVNSQAQFQSRSANVASNVLTYTFTGLDPVRTTFSITASTNDGTSSNRTVEVTPTAPPPPAQTAPGPPTGVTGTPNRPNPREPINAIRISWKAPSSWGTGTTASRTYRIVRFRVVDGQFETYTDVTTKLEYTVPAVAGTTYVVSVRSETDHGMSAYDTDRVST